MSRIKCSQDDFTHCQRLVQPPRVPLPSISLQEGTFLGCLRAARPTACELLWKEYTHKWIGKKVQWQAGTWVSTGWSSVFPSRRPFRRIWEGATRRREWSQRGSPEYLRFKEGREHGASWEIRNSNSHEILAWLATCIATVHLFTHVFCHKTE